MVKQDSNDLEKKIVKLHNQTKSYLNEIKKLIAERDEPNKMNIISYFTYSLNISHDPEQESLCLGSYHVLNMGNQPITNPHIYLKIPIESCFSFSGKYVYGKPKQLSKVADGWERINEKTNKEEFWLKPLDKTSIEPNEKISFSNFQINWAPTESYSGSIIGFTYSDQMKEGVAVINPININGTIRKQEDENE